MALPYTIANGQTPDASKLAANLAWLAAGKGILSGTLAEIQAAAAATPSEPFIAMATLDDGTMQLMAYTGNPSVGTAGFFTLAAGGTINTTEENVQ